MSKHKKLVETQNSVWSLMMARAMVFKNSESMTVGISLVGVDHTPLILQSWSSIDQLKTQLLELIMLTSGTLLKEVMLKAKHSFSLVGVHLEKSEKMELKTILFMKHSTEDTTL